MLKRFLRQSYLAITDFGFYPSVFEQSWRLTLLFLLFLCASLAIFLTLVYAWQLGPQVDRFFDWAEQTLPPLEVRDGTLILNSTEPILVTYSDESTWTFVFDTGGTYLDPVGLDEPALLFTEQKFFIRIQGQTQTYVWSDFGDFSINRGNIGEYETTLKFLYFPFAYGFLLVYSLLGKGFTALLLCPLAYSVGSTYGIRLTLQNCFTICLYSLVPAVAVDMAVQLTGLKIDYFEIIYLAAAAIYTFFATQKCVTAH
ncbi:MAG: DUF1189 family protein [Acidobacteriota bacterium]|nr:MAG: DUF1189 family protein [Acidobacteriota bacterium]